MHILRGVKSMVNYTSQNAKRHKVSFRSLSSELNCGVAYHYDVKEKISRRAFRKGLINYLNASNPNI